MPEALSQAFRGVHRRNPLGHEFFRARRAKPGAACRCENILLPKVEAIDMLGAASVFRRADILEARYPMFELLPIAHRRLLATVLVLLVCPAQCRLVAQTAPSTPPAPRALTPSSEQLAIQAASETDHQRMVDLLGIKELRRGAEPSAKSPYAANYDESKADVYPNLPDPLLLKNGNRVASAKVWWTKRRPEIVEDFDRDIYGRVPANLPRVTWEVVSTTAEKVGDVPVVTKKLMGHVDNSAYPQIAVSIELLLTTPAHAAGPVPVILQLAFPNEFKAALLLPNAGSGSGSPGGEGWPWQQQVLAKGWGYAELIPTSYQADNGAGLTEGIIGLMNKGRPRKLDDWGVLRAWAWGASRALDYFETDKSVDAKQVGLEGHSRYGKAALVTMAYDPRFAIAYISSSGEGGAKLYRHIFGEQIGNVAGTSEYHWMAGNFLKYAGPLTPGDLPVDNHELIALCAPRPVFIGAGSSVGDGYANPGGDAWADAKGMFLAEVGAGPVYRLLGKNDLGAQALPPIGTALIEGDLAFRQHSGGHTPAPNWPTFLSFAGRYLHGPAAAKAR
jgi:hypothetical protein